jgi:hypothetical protein
VPGEPGAVAALIETLEEMRAENRWMWDRMSEADRLSLARRRAHRVRESTIFLSYWREMSERTRRLEERRARMEDAFALRAAEFQRWQESLETWMALFQKSVTEGLGEIASRIGREEDRGNIEANLVEDALTRLARVDAEALEDALHREDDWRDELETKLRRFLEA